MNEAPPLRITVFVIESAYPRRDVQAELTYSDWSHIETVDDHPYILVLTGLDVEQLIL